VSDPYRDPPAAPYRAPGVPSTPCPRCAVGLSTSEVAGLRLEVCARCEGLFIGKGPMMSALESPAITDELRAILPRTRTAQDHPGPMYVKCPQCATLMNRSQYMHGAKVIIDYCKRHGIWFDAGELPVVLDFHAGGGAERAKAHAEQQARDAERAAELKRQTETAKARWEVSRFRHQGNMADFFAALFS